MAARNSMKARFREPIKHTCPDIDSIIAMLEKLRQSNATLRDWGFDEANRVDELEEELSDKDKEIERLFDEVDKRDDTIKKLEDEIKELYKNQP